MVLLVSAEAADAIHKEAHGLGADEDSAGDGQTGHGVALGFPEAFADGFLILQARPSGSRRSSPAKWKRSSAAPRTYAEWVTDHANDFRN
jgi:hypothetical protein